jgi:sulfite reductase alpha subunit-like flavoprotein
MFHIPDVAHLANDAPCRYEAGDVAIIHPEASDIDVESFLNSMGWANVADDPFTIENRMTGTLHHHSVLGFCLRSSIR